MFFEPSLKLQSIEEAQIKNTKINKLVNVITDMRAAKLSHDTNGVNENLRIIAKTFCEVFGFGNVIMGISDDTGLMNAYTYISAQDLDESYIKAFKFDPKKDVECTIILTKPLIIAKEITSEEVLAIMLHEVGHHFDVKYGVNYFRKNRQLKTTYTKLHNINILIRNAEDKKTRDKILKDMTKDRDIDLAMIDMGNLLAKMLSSISNLGKMVKYFLSRDVDTIMRFMVDLDSKEEMADQVAVTFGYGPQLASGLAKINIYNRSLVQRSGDDQYAKPFLYFNKYVNLICSFVFFPLTLRLFKMNPSTYARLNNILAGLEKDLQRSDTILEKDKKELQRQIKDIKEIIADYDKMDEELKEHPADAGYNPDGELGNYLFKYYIKTFGRQKLHNEALLRINTILDVLEYEDNKK